MAHTKLKELILYVADKCQYQPAFGATKLNKILFFADFLAYGQFEESITGEEYFKLPYGPAPKYLKTAREELLAADDIVIIEKPQKAGVQIRIIPKREANMEKFDAKQVALVDSVIEQLEHYNAEEISGLSHKFYGWQITKDQEVIPYETIFLSGKDDRPITTHKQEIAQKLAEKYGI